MNIVDSSGWLEFFTDGPNAENFLPPIQDPSNLIVPIITIYEVFKVILRESSEYNALQAVTAMEKGQIEHMTKSITLKAARISLEHSLPMADSLILATAREHNCTIWTQDSDFQKFPGVIFFSKKR